mmetsp:Transcript_58/g.78  ORF Transcript_58/g.78 Transcript_58/m.78 type:complete len:103 (+) Transcript_58:13-321(+)
MKSNARKFATKGIITGYKRGLRKQKSDKVIVKLNEPCILPKYLGKKVLLFKENKNLKKKKEYWGKIVSLHGRTGGLIATFKKPITPSFFPSDIIIMPFPVKY